MSNKDTGEESQNRATEYILLALLGTVGGLFIIAQPEMGNMVQPDLGGYAISGTGPSPSPLYPSPLEAETVQKITLSNTAFLITGLIIVGTAILHQIENPPSMSRKLNALRWSVAIYLLGIIVYASNDYLFGRIIFNPSITFPI